MSDATSTIERAPHDAAAGSPQGSPFHAGELAVQRRAGVSEFADAAGRVSIRAFMPDQHRTFYAQLPWFVVGGVDRDGQPWATLRAGEPGFIDSPDPRTLRLQGGALRDDPLAEAWQPGAPFGGLGIELPTRRRNRVNGTVAAIDGTTLSIAVKQSFGNCPKYIQRRTPEPVALPHPAPPLRHADALGEAERELIARADTFFVASANLDAEARVARGVDVSHRGGAPGFVRVDDARTLTVPDYAGNRFFNTLGNFASNPRAGLLFIDFACGDLLYMAAEAEIVWDGPDLAAFEGAQRLVRYRLREVRRSEAALPFRWSEPELAPQFASETAAPAKVEAAAEVPAPAAVAEAEAAPAAQAAGWFTLRVVATRDEAPGIRSFHFERADGVPLPPHDGGQHVTLRIPMPDEAAPLVRSYTLSDAAGGPTWRISVKRDGQGSSRLHESLQVGSLLEARGPGGNFRLDRDGARPVVMLSAGIGITPMLAMLRERAALPHRAPRVVFFHGARQAADRPFVDELADCARRDPTLTVHLFDSQPSASGSDGHHAGRLGIDALRRLLPFDSYDFHICGPSAFMTEMVEGLRALDVPEARIHYEAFGPSSVPRRARAAAVAEAPVAAAPDPAAQAASATSPAPATSAVVEFRRSGVTADWSPSDGSLLELAEARGIDALSSCRAGACGTCTVRVLEGGVCYPQPPGGDFGPGEALACVAQPAGAAGDAPARVVLDL
ncbi:MAG: pyridoxamine 5'-phosphate oxidase family protein [Burkholderia gladioli]